eukprot:1449441-Prymnesium_polylepis.1
MTSMSASASKGIRPVCSRTDIDFRRSSALRMGGCCSGAPEASSLAATSVISVASFCASSGSGSCVAVSDSASETPSCTGAAANE